MQAQAEEALEREREYNRQRLANMRKNNERKFAEWRASKSELLRVSTPSAHRKRYRRELEQHVRELHGRVLLGVVDDLLQQVEVRQATDVPAADEAAAPRLALAAVEIAWRDPDGGAWRRVRRFRDLA